MSKNGFTLVELLVAISIIAIMSAIGFMTYTTVSKQGRDSKRQSDLRTIQSALENYYRDQGFYPFGTNGSSGLDDKLSQVAQAFTNAIGNPVATATKSYLNALPTDPQFTGTGRYCYLPSPAGCDNSSVKCTSYSLFARLENTATGTGSCSSYSSYNLIVTPP
jgi:prepilin-type N-terminal cleavage/methylation domain-containing protein